MPDYVERPKQDRCDNGDERQNTGHDEEPNTWPLARCERPCAENGEDRRPQKTKGAIGGSLGCVSHFDGYPTQFLRAS